MVMYVALLVFAVTVGDCVRVLVMMMNDVVMVDDDDLMRLSVVTDWIDWI